nr:NTP transferase domain-containing protein [Acidimicrobiia bacterium]
VEDGRLAGVRTVGEFPAARPAPPVAVVMVGGRGERLRPLTDKLPKPLLRIGGTSIVERIVGALGQAGIEEVWLSVNYLAEEFEARLGDGSALGVHLHYLHEEEVLGTAGGLSLLPERPVGPVLVTNGDLVTTVDFAALVDFHWHHQGAVTVTAVEHLTAVPYGVLRTAEHHLLAIDEKPARRDLINAGMYVLEPEVLRFVSPGVEVGMPELIAAVIAEGLPVHAFPVLERWFDIGSPEEFEKVLLAFATGEEE